MSNQPTGQPDWRRQPGTRRGGARRRRGPAPPSNEASIQAAEAVAAAPPADAQPPEAQEVVEAVNPRVVSRTLFSYLEPVLNTIGAFSLPLVMAGIVALVAGITLVGFVSSMRFYGLIILLMGLVLLGLVGAVSLSSIAATFVSRTGRYGVNSLVMVAAFLGIIIVAGFLSFENHLRLDVTANQQFSLSNRARQLLTELEHPVRVTAFYVTEYQDQQDVLIRRNQVEQTLREFKVQSSRFSYRFVDPDLKPDITSEYFGATPGAFVNESIVVENLDSRVTHVIKPSDEAYSELEQDLVTSLLVVTGQGQKTLYFLSGHGERSIQSSAPDGYDTIRNGLERENYLVEILSWDSEATDITVPEDADLLIIARPTAELPEAHARVLDMYLQGRNPDGTPREKGGRLIFLAEPDTIDSFRQFLARWGAAPSSGYIRDLDQSVPGLPHTLRLRAFNPLESQLDLSTVPRPILETLLGITSPRGQSLGITLMPGAAPLIPLDDGLRLLVPLAITSSNSFLIQDVERTDPKTGAGEESDPRGPFFPVMYIQAVGPVGTQPPTSLPPDNQIPKIVIFGDSDFITNSSFNQPSGGPDFFLNSANYLVGDIALESIRPKALDFREFNLDKNEFNFVRFSSWFLLPGLMGLAAAMVWWVRR